MDWCFSLTPDSTYKTSYALDLMVWPEINIADCPAGDFSNRPPENITRQVSDQLLVQVYCPQTAGERETAVGYNAVPLYAHFMLFYEQVLW